MYLSCEEALRFPLYEADRDAARVHLEPSEVRFAVDSPLEEGGFEPSVPCGGWRLGLLPRSYGKFRRAKLRFAPDSPLEGDGFEPSVPQQIRSGFRDSLA